MSHGEPKHGWIDGVCMKHSYSEGLVCSVCYKEKMDQLDKAIMLLRELVGSESIKEIFKQNK